jgi:hypothetical protein
MDNGRLVRRGLFRRRQRFIHQRTSLVSVLGLAIAVFVVAVFDTFPPLFLLLLLRLLRLRFRLFVEVVVVFALLLFMLLLVDVLPSMF